MIGIIKVGWWLWKYSGAVVIKGLYIPKLISTNQQYEISDQDYCNIIATNKDTSNFLGHTNTRISIIEEQPWVYNALE